MMKHDEAVVNSMMQLWQIDTCGYVHAGRIQQASQYQKIRSKATPSAVSEL